ncbi:MAG: calcium channel protein [Thelocarpon impressellum]|nr:MAG: calcium channel protein [Thelocarpon impressellum]
MASNQFSRDPLTPPSIPLQNLSRPPDSQRAADRERTRPRAGTRQGRNLLRGGDGDPGGASGGTGYARVAEDSPTPTNRQSAAPGFRMSTPFDTQAMPYTDDDGAALVSPVEDLSGFQEAMGFAGLSFQADVVSPPPDFPAASEPGFAPYPEPPRRNSEESQYYTSHVDNDTTPLTDPRYLQPVSGALAEPDLAQPHDRSSFQSVRISSPGSPGRRLGDDLPGLEAGRSRGASHGSAERQRSLSPHDAASSPLSRAGSVMRKMSQRVVNLSNEPDMVEHSIRRKPSQARMDAPPSFPAMAEYAHDASPAPPPRPIEKLPPSARPPVPQNRPWQKPVNPLKGKTLGLFDADNALRLRLCDLLVHPVTEPFILVLIVIQTVLLAIEAAPNVFVHPRSKRWPGSWMEVGLLALFVIYTLEIAARVIVSGLVMNADEYSTLDRRSGLAAALVAKARSLFSPQRRPSKRSAPGPRDTMQPSILRSITGIQAEQAGHTRQAQRIRLARRAFLRHSFNRLDFVAVVSFWISFVLAIVGIESEKHIYVFRMLSCLRILRLLGLTSGTSVILRSLKKAAPLLANVAFLIGFFWLLFAIVGVQSFKSSLRRTCVFVDPDPNGPIPQFTQQFQFCGGHLNNETGKPETFVEKVGGTTSGFRPKGYLCPKNSVCVEQQSPYNGTVSFDNILQSLQLIFVIMSSNTYTDLMYYTTQSDYLIAALFFSAAMVIMSLFLINLLVAVIISSFQVIREESKASAFTASGDDVPLEPDEASRPAKVGALKALYGKTVWLWNLVIVYGLLVQCYRESDMGEGQRRFIDLSETVVTFILLLEILLRFASDWRHFHKSRRNWVDLGLAVITTVMQIPPIHNSGAPYAWLTLFQILRVYRLVLAVSVTRDLIMVVLGNVSGILNLIVFVFLLTFLGAIFAVQIFRDEIPAIDVNGFSIRINFHNIFNAFVGMYQILSSENWTLILYNITSFETRYDTAWIGAAFTILWFILANFIVLNMFIAVIQENFDVTEDEKRLEQVKAFLQRKDLGGSSQSNLSLAGIFHLGRGRRAKDPLDYGPATMEMLLKDAVVQEFLEEEGVALNPKAPTMPVEASHPAPATKATFPANIRDRLIRLWRGREVNPFHSGLQFSRGHQDLDPRTMAEAVVSATEQRKRAQREYLLKHPMYNVSLFLFKPSNPIRRACQRIVGPGRGSQRIQGVEPFKAVWFCFSAFIYAAIIAMVLLACVTTPLYQREYFRTHPFSVKNWFLFSDMAFAILFTVEAIVKVIADGFFFTPNAYFHGAWGFVDGLVLVTLWVDVGTSLQQQGEVSRAVGAFKALRALRLLNFSDSARHTFQSVIILGGWKVISAAFVSLSLLVPFAIYGLNLFNGQFRQCNDNQPGQSLVNNLTADCVGEYFNQPYNQGWAVLQPRANLNLNYFNFDDFRSSLFILFQIVSQEGWTDVMWQAQSMTGLGRQPQPNATPGNAVFFIAFNLLGAVFVLTLFISVFMRNYTEQTGVAFLTADQRSWLELRKLLRQISPSKRPTNKPDQRWRNWCYRQAVKKHGKWQRFITLILVVHLILLVVEFYPENDPWEIVRDFVFLAFTVFYIVNIVIRLVGLTWARFRRSSWDLYSVFAVSGTLVTSVLLLSDYSAQVYIQLHKLFLVSIALLLIPRNNQLDQLFKTAAASLTSLGNLLATWFVLFLVYAIALTQTFGLTRFGPMENSNLNFRDVPRALILLFRTSSGEGWNQIMEDYAHITEPNCVSNDDFFESDCGSATWARVLFISWNILSMYIFVSLFVSLIFESFSYVYQRSNGLSIVSREEIRRFKQAWATFDPEGTGYISKEAFPRLLGELSGVFEMRIYEGDYTVGSILEACRVDATAAARTAAATTSPPGVVEGVDLAKLNARVAAIPVGEVRRRRRKLNVFYEEVMVSAEPAHGISFTSVLMILAHYNVITDTKSLRLEEFLRRRARLQRVQEAVRRNIVIGFFDKMFWSRYLRRILDHREAARMQSIPTFAVPEIFVDDDGDQGAGAPGASPGATAGGSPWAQQHQQQGQRYSSSGLDPLSPSALSPRHRGEPSLPPSPGQAGEWGDISPGPSPHRHGYSDGFDWPATTTRPGLSTGEASGRDVPGPGPGASARHRPGRDNAGGSVSAQDVLQVLDNSAWGESIRRSFTLQRRGDSQGR